MRVFNKILLSTSFVLMMLSSRVFAASAYLEGTETPKPGPSIFDDLDSSTIMANWYKIVLIAVAVLCVIGLIVSNIVWLIKKRKNNQ